MAKRRDTEERLRHAVDRLAARGESLTQASVSKEAGVGRATLNRYPGAVDYLKAMQAESKEGIRVRHKAEIRALREELAGRNRTINVLATKLRVLTDEHDRTLKRLRRLESGVHDLASHRRKRKR